MSSPEGPHAEACEKGERPRKMTNDRLSSISDVMISSVFLCFILTLVSTRAASGRPPTTDAEVNSKEVGVAYREKWTATLSGVERGCAGVDQDRPHGGAASGVMAIEAGQFNAAAGLSQSVSAKRYRGRRVSIEAYMATEDVASGTLLAAGTSAAAFLEVQVISQKTSADNLERCQSTSMTGTVDWQKVTLSFDVARDADVLTLGALLVGKGKAWVDDFRLVDVGRAAERALSCVDAFPLRRLFGTHIEFRADWPDLLNADFEEKPPFYIEPRLRKTCKAEAGGNRMSPP
jgi:hypothetical protein